MCIHTNNKTTKPKYYNQTDLLILIRYAQHESMQIRCHLDMCLNEGFTMFEPYIKLSGLSKG